MLEFGMIKLLLLAIFLSPLFLFWRIVKKGVEKRKKSSWEGKLVDKEQMEYEDDDSSYTKDIYTLHFETTDGSKVKLNVPQKIYDDWQVGDRAKKDEGELHPKKV